MPLSRMENTTFAMPSIIDSHDMGLRTVYSPDARNSTPIQRPIIIAMVACHRLSEQASQDCNAIWWAKISFVLRVVENSPVRMFPQASSEDNEGQELTNPLT
ncbi:hypothetical protein TNCV_1547361 [Trichonephila clavipes]|nr:hypothetical protein TNCV_1547361 [Trichonephila clavipes]